MSALQRKLAAVGFVVGTIDGEFGARTHAAVVAFQRSRGLAADGIAGPATLAALSAHTAPRSTAPVVPCNAETWAAFERFRDAIVGRPVRYGPGRGLWSGDRFMITYGPGRLGGSVATWPNILGKRYPSLHCTSWTNLFLSWLLRRNEDYTHSGNIPLLQSLLAADSSPHVEAGVGTWRGFAGSVTAIDPDGSGSRRSGFPGKLDARELLARAGIGELPTFVVFSQSTKVNGYWNRDHHTGLYVSREGRLYRIAADGYKGASGYSAQPMAWLEITDSNVGLLGAAAYSCWGVDTFDGSYGDQRRPIAGVSFEAP